MIGQVAYAMKPEPAFKAADWLDEQRKGFIRTFHGLLQQRYGISKATGFIFAVNLFGAGLFQHSVLGVLLMPPFVFLLMGGFLVSLLVRKYSERLLITMVVCPFEFGAFVIAATGGIGVGLSVLGIGNSGGFGAALGDWAILFITLVVPLQFVGALLEAILGDRLPESAWPKGVFDEQE